MSKRRNKKVNQKKANKNLKQDCSHKINNMECQKSKPEIKKYIISGGISYFMIVIGYLFLCSLQSLVKYGELGHFFMFDRHSRSAEITDSPIRIICYFALLLLLTFIPFLIMYIKEMWEYKRNQKHISEEKSKIE